jgi:molybdopterin converting factor small subunit
METRFQIPRVLQEHSGGKLELRLAGGTIRAVLAALRREYPALYGCLCNETGAVRQHLNLFVNNQFIRDLDGLDTRLGPHDVVSVYQAVSGG